MSSSKTCIRCGASIEADSPLDVCLRCVAPLVLSPDSAGNGGEATGSFGQGLTGGDEKHGQRVGAYKILQKIGEGGCGVVYMAEQQEPVRRRVALKIVKLGMDTRQVIARFEAERQALAMMDHPNIAKVLDAGATDTGRPYFVMELVRGVPISQYCDEANLSTGERLRLFTQVCQAVQHAHQKGIVHRDLKPANILVTINDGVPVPKVIDFGIAKAIAGQQLTDKTLFTAFEQFIGTPVYMSPEQAMMTSLDIDTRSDIYSLGVLLYELLTGKTPFDQKKLLHAGIDALRRTIQEQEPERPSARLSTLPRADLTTAAKRRSTDAPRLIHAIQGDLDWIVMKCLEKDRRRRYETASGLAADVERHLAHEPVLARPPSALYKLRKTIRRNRIAFAAGGAVALALLLGLCVALWQVVQKNQAYQKLQAEAERTRREAAKSEQVVRLLRDMLNGAGPLVALGRDTTILREILDRTAERIETELKDQPEVEAQLRDELGWVYDTILESEKAEAMLREAVAIRKSTQGDRHLDVAQSLILLSVALESQYKNAAAENVLREALSITQESAEGTDLGRAAILSNLSIALERQGKLEEAEQRIAEAISLKRKVLGAVDLDVAMSLVNLGNVHGHRGRTSEAEAAYREALAILPKLPDGGASGSALSLKTVATANLSAALYQQKRYADMEQVLRTSLAAARHLYGVDSGEAAFAVQNLAGSLALQGKLDEADKLMAETIPTYSSEVRRSRLQRNWSAQRGRWNEAAIAAAKVVELEPENHESYHDLAPLLVQIGDLEGYRKHCQQEVARFQHTLVPHIAERMAKDCLILADSGVDLDVVTAWTDTALTAGHDHTYLPWFQLAKCLVEYRRRNFTAAGDWATTVLNQPDRENRDLEALSVLAMAQHRLHQSDEARATLAKATELEATLPQLSSGDVGTEWLDWIIAHALWSEAKELIEGSPPPVSAAAAP